MCAENGEVILCCLKVSHRPGEENQSNQNKTQTKKKTNKPNNLAKTRLKWVMQSNTKEVKQGVSNIAKRPLSKSCACLDCSKVRQQSCGVLGCLCAPRAALAPGLDVQPSSMFASLHFGEASTTLLGHHLRVWVVGRHASENH